MLPGYEIKSMIHCVGLAALGFTLVAMSMKNILILRILSAIANFIYIIYGFLLASPPLMIGGAIVIVIHGYHIHRLIQTNRTDTSFEMPTIRNCAQMRADCSRVQETIAAICNESSHRNPRSFPIRTCPRLDHGIPVCF